MSSAYSHGGDDSHTAKVLGRSDSLDLTAQLLYDSDSISDMEGCDYYHPPFKTVDSRNGFESSWCYYDKQPSTSTASSSPSSSEPLETLSSLLDSHVFVFDPHSSSTDELDFCCAGEDRQPLWRCSSPYGVDKDDAPHMIRPQSRPWSMPCTDTSWNYESLASSIPAQHTFRNQHPKHSQFSYIPALDRNVTTTGGLGLGTSNKWGNNPPAGYI